MTHCDRKAFTSEEGMANREACEVYIEQEIESGLEEGKTPYPIGKELSDWVARLFEVRISPKTLETRAYRQKSTSNEVKESNDEINTITYDQQESSLTHPVTERGGKREGAGRKPMKVTEAMDFTNNTYKMAY
jgi:hypothetical protein